MSILIEVLQKLLYCRESCQSQSLTERVLNRVAQKKEEETEKILIWCVMCKIEKSAKIIIFHPRSSCRIILDTRSKFCNISRACFRSKKKYIRHGRKQKGGEEKKLNNNTSKLSR